MYAWFFNCRKFTEQVSRTMDADPSRLQRLFVWLRRRICRNSDRFARQLEILRSAARDEIECRTGAHPAMRLPPETCARMKAALRLGRVSGERCGP